ncbi:hypothetical protein HMF7854_02250 [Sphingomonas ginkgonis]|uniref:Zinc finger/thioredoxin putative domain-containing protein n=1 Tax=Sphingomonas ginkgonis TaxID=2315330 RepID=A0A429V722_9SPHN|nr:zinc-ribbon domain-containing protein [Sphingomonas ginkgonis]RST29776.1 hypothetical protein HMF7854_02250 [Sphingomonas ginkgonis]
MILTCPECGTRYVVKDGAIPPEGRQVRCASCRHSWHQDPEVAASAEQVDDTATAELASPTLAHPVIDPAATRADPDTQPLPEPGAGSIGALHDSAAYSSREAPEEEAAASEGGFLSEAVPPPAWQAEPQPAFVPAAEPEEEPAATAASEPLVTTSYPESHPFRAATAAASGDDDYSPFATRAPVERASRRGPLIVIGALVLIVAIAAAFWFLAPAQWKQRVGVADNSETPLLLQVQQHDRQKLESGNELFAVSGRVLNPTNQTQSVPPIKAELRNTSGKLIYSWTISPPTRALPPGASAAFNSAEMDVPQGADMLTVTLG